MSKFTIAQYERAYTNWQEMLKHEHERIIHSSECRKTLIKNTDTADLLDLLQEAVNCIYDLTGDRCFLKQVTESIERRRNAST